MDGVHSEVVCGNYTVRCTPCKATLLDGRVDRESVANQLELREVIAWSEEHMHEERKWVRDG